MLAITTGEPAGIGLELLSQLSPSQLDGCILVGDHDLIKTAMPHWPNEQIQHTPLNAPNQLGQLNPANAKYVLETIRLATEGCTNGSYHAMVTCPIHKGVINDAGIPFSGHTEYLAKLTDTDEVVMMLLNDAMRVALVTTHIPLLQVPSHITEAAIIKTTSIVAADLRSKFGIEKPRIALCGLNPHAGENGHMGHEEIDTIIPAIEKMQSAGLRVSGPYPADTLFTQRKLKGYDAVIAMFHDQGLAPLKYAGFGTSVNITLGLPIIRTSVDHGTALDIVGQGLADAGSLAAAIQCARDCVKASS